MSYRYDADVEKQNPEAELKKLPDDRRPSFVDETGAVSGEAFEYGDTLYAKAQRLAGKFKIEQRGIERVPEDERTDNKHPLANVATMVSPGN